MSISNYANNLMSLSNYNVGL